MSREKAPSPKAEALGALADVADGLMSDTPLTGRQRVSLAALVQYAIAQVGEIAELRRARRVKAGS